MSEFEQARAIVDRFARTRPRFEELKSTIAIFVRAGWSLQEAYNTAVSLDCLIADENRMKETARCIVQKEGLKMPSKSPKQARTMRAAAHNPAFAKKMQIPQKVAREFVAADKAKGKSKRK